MSNIKSNIVSFISGALFSSVSSIHFINPLKQNNYIMCLWAFIILMFLAIMGGIAGLGFKDLIKKRKEDDTNIIG